MDVSFAVLKLQTVPAEPALSELVDAGWVVPPPRHPPTACALPSAMFQYDGESYEEMVDEARSSGADLQERERARFGLDHAELAEAILSSWNLPVDVCLAGAEHHSALMSSAMSAAVHTGCFGAEYMGFGECGSHSHAHAESMPPRVAELMEWNYLPQVLPLEVNRVECSLL